MTQLEQLKKTLLLHRIKVDSDFTLEKGHIHFHSHQVEEAYDKTLKIIIDTVSEGKALVCKANVKKLANILVKLQKGDDATIHLVEYNNIIRNEKKKINNKTKSKKMEAQLMIKKELIKLLDSSLNGIEILKLNTYSEELRPDRYAVLTDSENVLKDIKEFIMLAPDGKSASAKEFAIRIANKLYDWRTAVSNGQINANKIEILNDAKKVANEWSEKKISAFSRNVKPNERLLFKDGINDNFEAIIKREKNIIDYKTFRNSLKEAKEDLDGQSVNVETHNEKIRENEREKAKIKQQKEEIENRNRALQLEASSPIKPPRERIVEIVRIIEANNKNIARYNMEIDNCTKNIIKWTNSKKKVEDNIRNRRWLIESLEFAVQVVDFYLGDANAKTFVSLSNLLDYNSMNEVAIGIADAPVVNNVKNAIEKLRRIATITEEGTVELNTDINTLINEIDDDLTNENSSRLVDERSLEDLSDEELLARISSGAMNGNEGLRSVEQYTNNLTSATQIEIDEP